METSLLGKRKKSQRVTTPAYGTVQWVSSSCTQQQQKEKYTQAMEEDLQPGPLDDSSGSENIEQRSARQRRMWGSKGSWREGPVGKTACVESVRT